ncbi:hypothetical protein KW787_04045 [Candidatus Pacearchaeota archaeon]|nr:hypothetical protein [Candidatus Pacearchaeota archaeon]
MAKSSISVELEIEVKKILEKRAKRELLTLRELVSDILRRSALSTKESTKKDNVDDPFISYFSRKNRKRK